MKYVCSICGYIYDESEEKTLFSELPATWKCPLCGAARSDFEAKNDEIKAEEKPNVNKITTVQDGDMKKMTAGQLAALFSNLARGCEKQYLIEETGLMMEISEYFKRLTPPEEISSLEELSRLLKLDISENYPLLKATAEESKDRGAQRICVWGEKVTRMLSSLVERYRVEGEAMLQGTEVWICTVCGFVYIGHSAPELCPVCKVPSWKFEKVEGRPET